MYNYMYADTTTTDDIEKSITFLVNVESRQRNV